MLLVFRIQTVGARWTEARAAWGFIFNGCRNVARLLSVWVTDPADRAVARRWTTALPLIARHHLRRHTLAQARPDIMTALSAAEADWLLVTARHHTPTAAAGVLESLTAKVGLAPVCELAVSNELNVYINAIGTCERIRGTNPPLAITRLTSRFCQTWLALLPWTLWSACHWLTVLLHAVVSLLLLGIDNIASQLEEPLQRLPLVIYAGVLADDVRHVWSVADGAAAVAGGEAPAVEEGVDDGDDDDEVVGAEPSVAPAHVKAKETV
jgi:predicted membrane chloride channel (bestrophin family)